MTIEAVNTRLQYLCDGVQRTFPVPFPVYKPEYVQAMLATGSGTTLQETPLVYGAGYTVNTLPSSGGELVLISPPQVGVRLVVWLALPYTQEMEIPAQGRLWGPSLEQAYDYLTMLCAQQAEGISRAVKVPLGEVETPEEFCNSLFAVRNQAENAAATATGQALAAENSAASAANAATAAGGAALAAQTEADRAKGYASKVEADIEGLEAHLITVGDAQVARVDAEGSVQVARAKAEADRAAAVVPAFTNEDKGKSLLLGALGPEWVVKNAATVPFDPVAASYPNHVTDVQGALAIARFCPSDNYVDFAPPTTSPKQIIAPSDGIFWMQVALTTAGGLADVTVYKEGTTTPQGVNALYGDRVVHIPSGLAQPLHVHVRKGQVLKIDWTGSATWYSCRFIPSISKD